MALTEFGCPLCPPESKGQIEVQGNVIVCGKDSSHRWNDTAEFKKSGAKICFTVAAPKFAPQTNHVPMNVMVPLGVKTTLETKWGPRLEATIAGVLAMMAEGEVLVIPRSDLQRMKERLGKIPESSGELFGMIYALGMSADDAKAEAENATKDLQAYRGMSPGRVVVDLGDQFGSATEKARGQEPPEPVEVFITRNVKNALSENWF
jgi:hypothetical protein